MKQYRYFVVYGANKSRDDCIVTIYGGDESNVVDSHSMELVLNNTVVSLERPILTEEDVRSVEQSIAIRLINVYGCWVVVRMTSFQLLGEFEEGE